MTLADLAKTMLITLKSHEEDTSLSLDAAMEHLGPLLAQSLMQNIGGNAARSELDKLCEPLKKFVVQRPQAQAWLDQALQDASFPSSKVSAEEKALFLKRIIRSGPHHSRRDLHETKYFDIFADTNLQLARC
jgi:hypothetical protein